MKIEDVLIKPVLTEKGTTMANNNVYMFEINRKVNKYQVKNILESIYKVEVDQVKIMNRKGKKKRVGRKMTVKKRPDRKIAFIKLSKGKIDIFPKP